MPKGIRATNPRTKYPGDPKRAKINEWHRLYRKTPEYREKHRTYLERWNKSEEGLAKKRSWHLRRYGISTEQYDATWASQGMKCAICKKSEHNGRGWCVDHCHSTGRFRGILCMPCNLALGYMNDDIAVIKESIKYLENSLK